MRRYNATLTQATTTVTVSLNDNEDVQVLLVQGSPGTRLVTWAGVTTWLTPAGTAPTLKTTVGAADLVTFSGTGATTYGLVSASAGAAGAAGSAGPAGINWRGAYSSATSYAPFDAVSGSGSSFYCLTANSAASPVIPGTDATVWATLAAGGSGTATIAGELFDNFTRANSSNISTGAPSGITWTKVTGTATEILSNMLHDTDSVGTFQWDRCETTMTSTDHHAQITLGSFTVGNPTDTLVGPIVRYEAAANSGYVAFTFYTGSVWRVDIQKFTAGAHVSIATGSTLGAAPQAGDTLKLAVLGSALVAYYNGVNVCSGTDATFTAGVRAGVMMARTGAAGDASISEFRFGT